MTAPPAPPPASALDADLDRSIQRQARRFARGDQALADDLAQEGRISAWQAAARYDPDRGVPLRPYLLHWSRIRMIGALRDGLQLADEPLDLDADRGDGGAGADRVEARLLVEQVVTGLKRTDRLVVEALLDESSDQVLADQLRCSTRTARRTRQLVVARLRSRLGDEPAVGQHKAAA